MKQGVCELDDKSDCEKSDRTTPSLRSFRLIGKIFQILLDQRAVLLRVRLRLGLLNRLAVAQWQPDELRIVDDIVALALGVGRAALVAGTTATFAGLCAGLTARRVAGRVAR